MKYTEVFIRILEIVGYTDDKEAFTRDFFRLCEKQAILNLIQALPEDKRLSVNMSLSQLKDAPTIDDALKEYFSEEDILQAYEKATGKLFNELLRDIAPTLTDEQKGYLHTYFQNALKESS